MHGKDVRLEAVTVTYPNGFTAVQPTNLIIKAGEFFSILGPSGCGKTTILRAISGFIRPSSGRILIGGDDQSGLTPNVRSTALIFQSLALFPLMSVWENVAFGLEARGVNKRKRREHAEMLLQLVALTDQADKKPGELSGGQRQRVAIARALAVEPSVLLLDEPLSALDLKLRQHMRAELRAIQRKTGVTFIYITHDQGEALTMSDRIAVMNAGVIEQVGTGDDIYSNPKTAFTASFVGETNRFEGHITRVANGHASITTNHGVFQGLNPTSLDIGEKASLFVRPEALNLEATENILTARLMRRDLEGPFVNLFFATSDDREISVHMTNNGHMAEGLSERDMRLGFNSSQAIILPEPPLTYGNAEIATS